MTRNWPSRQQVDEWKQHPVTEAMRVTLTGFLDGQEQAARDAYWQGGPLPDETRIALRMTRELIEQMFAGEIEAEDERGEDG